MKFRNQGFDHVEYIVHDRIKQGCVFERMGFEKIGERRQKETSTDLWAQGRVRVMLTQPEISANDESASEHSIQFLRAQDEGICVLAVEVESAKAAYEETMSRGARSAMVPTTFVGGKDSSGLDLGTVVRAEIWTPGLVRYAFIERSVEQREAEGNRPAYFDNGLVAKRLISPAPFGIQIIDHLTNNVTMGDLEKWVNWYKNVFGFVVSRHFLINTGRTGLNSDVVESPCGKIKVPINEATEPESQVQEFVTRLKGPGVQHLALTTNGVIETLKSLKKSDFKFLSVPHSYYEAVPTRVPGVSEDLAELESLGLLLDGDQTGYLMQIFSEEILGPFFFEYIQRKGNRGFGEGNFKALFEAIERDQIKRGVLKA